MAELYLARYKAAGGAQKIVAIKRVLPHYADDPDFLTMFRNETRIAATLDHPNIAQVLDFGESGEDRFIAMEYVHGVTLRDVLRSAAQGGGLPLRCALSIVIGVAQGLHYAHEACGADGRPLGLVHRDVSPTNVLLTYDGAVKIVDFGIAKATTKTRVTRTGTLKGKPSYMSPEQCRIADVDRRSDVFALGILLYEATTLRRLFTGPNDYAVMNKVADGEFDPPSAVVDDYPPALEAIVLKALQRDPADRYPTARAFQEALEAFAATHGLSLSALNLSDHLANNFECPSYPTADWTAPSIPTPLDRPHPPPTAPRLRGAGVIVAAVALAAGGYIVGGWTSSDSPAAAGAPQAELPATPDRVAPKPKTPAPAGRGASSTEANTPRGGANPPPVAGDASSADTKPAAVRTKETTEHDEGASLQRPAKPAKRRKSRRPKGAAKPPLKGKSSLLPPSGRVDK